MAKQAQSLQTKQSVDSKRQQNLDAIKAKLSKEATRTQFTQTKSAKANAKTVCPVDYAISAVNNIARQLNELGKEDKNHKAVLPWKLIAQFAKGQAIKMHFCDNIARKRYYQRLFSPKSPNVMFKGIGVKDLTDSELTNLLKVTYKAIWDNRM